jgi:hypothetical protein
MFDSGVTAQSLISGMKNEIDIAPDIPNSEYVMWLNSLQQLLYSEFIREQRRINIDSPPPGVIALSEPALDPAPGESRPRFEDIYLVYADGRELIKTSLSGGALFPGAYYKVGSDLGYNVEGVGCIEIIYFVRPVLISVTDDVIGAGSVMLPYEFLDLVKARLRGEAYKLANEDDTAAKWLNDYNVLLENFKNWLLVRTPKLGL